MEFLKGKKTYIVAALMLLAGIVEGLTGGGWEGMLANAQVILNGLGLMTLRAGIKSK